MSDDKGQLPLDARLLSEAIIELNISRRNVSIYPRGHPSVERTLDKVYNFLVRLFELRNEITLAVAKDTLIIDQYFLDKKNPVYREFALQLNKMNIAYVTFRNGLTKDELYEFHRFIAETRKNASTEELKEALRDRKILNMEVGFVDYGAFALREGSGGEGPQDERIWERYIHSLLQGTLQPEDAAASVQDVPPGVLAMFLNQTVSGDLKEETYDKVITTYMRRSAERVFSTTEVKKLLDFISALKPELKRHFLSSTVKGISRDMGSAEEMLRSMPIDKIIGLLTSINEQQVAIPQALKNLLNKLSSLPREGFEDLSLGDGLVADDVFLAPDVLSLLEKGEFSAFVTETYQKEIERLLAFDTGQVVVGRAGEVVREFGDDYVDRHFRGLMHELISSPHVSEEEYRDFLALMQEETAEFLMTGQYGVVLNSLSTLEANRKKDFFPEVTDGALGYFHSHDFLAQFVESLRIVGRQARDEALRLCEYTGERIIPLLIDVLIEEEAQAVRRFFISLITRFGELAVPEIILNLDDERWYVKRNMLFILSEVGSTEAIAQIRHYCHHENPKVSFEAIKCLLKVGDEYGARSLRDLLKSGSREIVEQAILISGSFKVRQVIPDLLMMLGKKSVSGADFHDKISVVRALGEIGDPVALDPMRELLSTKTLFFKGAVEELKQEIYKTLKKYPYEAVRDLVEAGIKSKHDTIREECIKTRRVHGR